MASCSLVLVLLLKATGEVLADVFRLLDWLNRFVRQDVFHFLVAIRVGKVIARWKCEHVFVISRQFTWAYWSRANEEFILLKLVPLVDSKDENRNILSRLFSAPFGMADAEFRAADLIALRISY
ncbi:hypothetical protein [Paenibacillus oryzisoli]|uniref:Secreted protein n=1 Tax=Paenibacillus oryzisoli TaxID=1850517 RepID=A0A198A067_9BACL|nr:hypothetical protein [Paenibacillus oryzisoli]OAS14849.1 hypothetical protein A8708_04940 [Paenibacillus oryzisoli]